MIKFTGQSPCAINQFVLDSTEAYEAKDGDIINLVYDSDFRYSVNFEADENQSLKRLSKEKMDEENDRVVKRPKSDESRWDSIDNDKCLVFTSSGVLASSKIAAYDLDNTLIKTVSGNIFPKSIDDWQLNMSGIPQKLQKYHTNGYKICVFTNQAGIESKRVSISDVKKKMTMIQQRLEVPMQFFIATGPTIYRKPRIGMWQLLQNRFNDDVKIDMTVSFFVGDAAGRPENKIMKRKKDHSSADRLLALNLNLPFYTPEEHFQNMKKNPSWIRPEFNPKTLTDAIKLIEPSEAQIKLNEQELIIMIGYPASGKSYFCNNYLRKEGYEVINRDTLNSMQKCVSLIENALDKKKSCVVDNTNPDPFSRKKFIDIATKKGIKCRCFLMTSSYHHSRHNNIFRELTDSTHAKIADVVFNTYKSKFVAPNLKEGFSEIVNVNCVPVFKNVDHENLYRMYLLEK